MKWVYLILACFITYMACLPCSDKNVTSPGKTIASIQIPADHEPTTHDYCSPLCVCNCCSTTLAVSHQLAFSAAAIIPVSTENLFFYQSSYSHFFPSIWQPPQV